MARPVMKSCIVFIISLAIGVFLENSILIATAVSLTAVAFLLFLIFRKNKKIIDCLKLSVFAILSIICLVTYNYMTVIPAQKYKGKTANIEATILSSDISSSQNKYYTARVDKIGSKAAPNDFRIRLFCSENDDLDDYDTIKADVNFFQDSLTSSDVFFQKNSILASAKTTSSIIVTNKNSFSLLREICKIRDNIVINIRAGISGENGAIVSGILFGKRDYISDDTTLIFASAGISHLLAISGLHLSIIVLLINLLLGLIIANKPLRSIITAIFSIVLMIMVGFTPSILRAFIMISFLLIAQNFRIDYDAPTALSFSALIICLINPYAITNIGFLLSYCATIGLLASNTIIDKIRMKFSLKTVSVIRLTLFEILKLFLPCLFAFLFTIPICSMVFGYFALYSPITNILIAPLLPITLAFCLLAAIFSLTPFNFIAEFFFIVCDKFISAIVFVAKAMASLPHSKIEINVELTLIVFIFIALIFAVALLSRNKKSNTIKAALLCIIIICFSTVLNAYTFKDTTTLFFSGDNTLVIEQNGEKYISGYTKSNEYRIKRYLNSSSDSQIAFLSGADANKNDMSSFTNFVYSNQINAVTVPKEYVSLFNRKNDKIYLSDKFSLQGNNIKITEITSETAHAIVYYIGNFKIISLNVSKYTEIKDKYICDLLILNINALSCIQNFESRYLLLSESVLDKSHINSLANLNKMVLLGDSSTDTISIKGNNLKIKRQILPLN